MLHFITRDGFSQNRNFEIIPGAVTYLYDMCTSCMLCMWVCHYRPLSYIYARTGSICYSSIKQQRCTAFCASKHTRSSYKSAIYIDSGLLFDASSEVFGGEYLALVVGSGKVGGGSCIVLGEGVMRAGAQRERDGGDSSLATTDSIWQQYRTAFCALKHTRSSYKPAIYVDGGLSFDASSEVYGGGDLVLAAGGGRAWRTGRYI